MIVDVNRKEKRIQIRKVLPSFWGSLYVRRAEPSGHLQNLHLFSLLWIVLLNISGKNDLKI